MTIRMGIVIGEFHKDIATEMLARIQKRAKEINLDLAEVVWVPGTYEAPIVVKKLLERSDIDCLTVVGYIEKGSTLHGEQMGVVTSMLFKELEQKYEKPIGIGIVGPGATREQALERLDYGVHGVDAAVRMVHLLQQMQ
ncbi:MAG: 6,7-dimethyl-8-ribityllumazine synthase [Candidatus Aenigmarchaeota archaeon]|nr:6,7-dimethyl-8-ribityllumazine synthase [Candidatus Aenigmarchaeota archaeon]